MGEGGGWRVEMGGGWGVGGRCRGEEDGGWEEGVEERGGRWVRSINRYLACRH